MVKETISWQDEVSGDSEVQFRVFVQSLRWKLEKFSNDFGEDWFVRIVRDRNLTGREFYVQLKGTPDIELP